MYDDKETNKGVIDVTQVVVPPERHKATEYDIPLNDNEFLFNPGHTKDLFEIGIIDQDKLFKIEKSTGSWGIVDLGTLPDSEAYKQNPAQVLDKLVYTIGTELKTSTVKSHQDEIRTLKSHEGEAPPHLREKVQARIANLETRLPRKRVLSEHRLTAINNFISRLTSEGVDLASIPSYEHAQEIITATLDEQI